MGEVTELLEGRLRNNEGRETGGFDLFEEEGVETSWGRGRVGGGEGERLLEAVVSSTLGLLDELTLLLPESPDSFIPIETDLCSSPLSSLPLLLALLDLLLLNKPDKVTDNLFLDLLDDRCRLGESVTVEDDAEEEEEEWRGKEGMELPVTVMLPLGKGDTVLPLGDDILRIRVEVEEGGGEELALLMKFSWLAVEFDSIKSSLSGNSTKNLEGSVTSVQ